ncbi:hypothetical protein ACEYW6_14505 [Nostoc sp. UIC 10607]|uniref:hypothetical protein n=1 Tax=Nostoc sp. UIC 10607 TaxID=3045935 RepID=UPI0039A0B082
MPHSPFHAQCPPYFLYIDNQPRGRRSLHNSSLIFNRLLNIEEQISPMLEIQRIFNQLRRKIAIVMLASLVWLISLPATSVQAEGYYSEKNHKVEVNKPYYTTKDRRVAQTESSKPYYATKERQKVKVKIPATGDNYIDSGKRATEGISRDSESESRLRNSRSYAEPRR